jgi:thioredoxin 2
MNDAVKITCPDCGQANRVAGDRLSAGPKCGTCGARLTDGKVAELQPATLKKFIKNDDLPLIVDFWAPWCGPCRMMAPEFAKAAKTLAPHVRFAKINTEDFPKVATERGIRGIPLLILFHKGREVARLPGARPARDIEKFVRSNVTVSQ